MVLVAPRCVRMSLKRTPASTPPVSWWSMTTCGIAASLYRRPVYGWVSTITTAVSGSIDHRLDRDHRNRNQLDHRPVLGPCDHAVNRQDHRLSRLAGFDQCLDSQHAGQRVRVGIDVRDQNDAIKGQNRGQQPIRASAATRAPARSRIQRFEDRPSSSASSPWRRAPRSSGVASLGDAPLERHPSLSLRQTPRHSPEPAARIQVPASIRSARYGCTGRASVIFPSQGRFAGAVADVRPPRRSSRCCLRS